MTAEADILATDAATAPAGDYCDRLDPATAYFWERGYCAAGAAFGRATSPMAGAAETVGTAAASAGSKAVEGAQALGGRMVDTVNAAIGDGLKPEVKLTAGGVAAILAVGLVGVAAADAYFLGGQGVRSLARMARR
jgi:hypothetical protein